MMIVVSVKMDSATLKKLDSTLKAHHYGTRTDFIREAIRDKLRAAEKEAALRALRENFGKAKTHTTDEDLERIREEVGREMAAEFDLE